MMFNIRLNHLSGYITYADCKVAPGPHMLTPILLPEFGKLHLQLMGGFTFQELDQGADVRTRVKGYGHVDMVRRNSTFEDFNVLLDTDSPEQIPRAESQVTCQHLVAVFSKPAEVNLNIKDSMGTPAIFLGHGDSILEVIA